MTISPHENAHYNFSIELLHAGLKMANTVVLRKLCGVVA